MGEVQVTLEGAGYDDDAGVPLVDATLTVLLVDDDRSQAYRIQERLTPYRILVEWRSSYREVIELLRDPDVGQLIDLILIDQAFEPSGDLLTHSEVDALAGTEGWDVYLHQGLFIMARLSQDMRDGLIPATPMMILTHYAKVETAAEIGLAGYESKRRLFSDPYAALKAWLPHMRPTELDVDVRLRKLRAALGLDTELTAQVKRRILGGLDLDETCAAVSRLAGTSIWQSVGRALEQLSAERDAFPVERLADALAAAWLPSPDGWLRISQVETLGPLGHGFEAFRGEVTSAGKAFATLVALRPVLASEAPTAAELRRGFDLIRRIDPRSRPLRLRDRSWTILGCWLPEPESPHDAAPATCCSLLEVTRHVNGLHRRDFAHGSLTILTTGFERPVFGGLRCLAGESDLGELRADDWHQLTALAAGILIEGVHAGVRHAMECWEAAVEAGCLDRAADVLDAVHRHHDPPAYIEFGRAHSGDNVEFRDVVLAVLRARDALLREVPGDRPTVPPLDFVVCVGGSLVVLEHRSRLRSIAVRDGMIVEVEAVPAGDDPPPRQPEQDLARYERTLARCHRSADVLATRVERALALREGSVERRAAIVVSDRTVVHSPDRMGWRAVMTESEAASELARLSRTAGAPYGVQMLPYLPRPVPAAGRLRAATRALHWTAVPLPGDSGVTMRTWSKRWPPASWSALLARLAEGERALEELPLNERPLPLLELRAYDGDGERVHIVGDAAVVELVEYDLAVPVEAAPLTTYSSDTRGDAGRRRLAVEVLRGLLQWERLRLAYSMSPDDLLQAGSHVYYDLLESVAAADTDSWWQQRRGAAACLVFLLSPWPFAWPNALAGTVSAASVPDRTDERSTWDIAATAVRALLDPDHRPGSLTGLLSRTAELLEAAARLGHRFPSWPVGLNREAVP